MSSLLQSSNCNQRPLTIFQLTQDSLRQPNSTPVNFFDIHTQVQLSDDFLNTKTKVTLRSANLPNLNSVTEFQLRAPFKSQLMILNLQNSHISKIDLSQFPRIQFLNLSQNPKLSHLTDISSLTLLQELYLSRNNLAECPKVTHLTFLEILDLTRNKLTSLSELPQRLKVVGVSGNSIEWFESGFVDWESTSEQLQLKYSQYYANQKSRHLAFKFTLLATLLAQKKEKSVSHLQQRPMIYAQKQATTPKTSLVSKHQHTNSRSRSLRALDPLQQHSFDTSNVVLTSL